MFNKKSGNLYSFSFQINLLIFRNPFMKIPILKKNRGYTRANLSSRTRKRNVTFIFQIFKKIFKQFIWNKKGYITWLLIGQFFSNFLITFRHYYYYAKYMFLISVTWLIFFRFFSYREVLKFWSYQTLYWEWIRKTCLNATVLRWQSFLFTVYRAGRTKN